MAALGRAATDQDILVSEHGRRFGIFGDGASGNPSGLILDNKVIASNRLANPFQVTVATGLSAAGTVTIANVQPGDTVVSVLDMSAAPFTDVSSSFESTISVAGQIKETASVSGHGILVIIVPRS
jgi:hypothetical protein